MTPEEKEEAVADIGEVAAAMIEKSLERQGLQIVADVTPIMLTATIVNWLDLNTEPAT